ncbi:MAG: NYN domain-containing protein [Proteobacteria bacterium]|nr:NYN domain-containing protein [Pseudomonadota bacterium]
MKKVAVLLDGGHVLHELHRLLGFRQPTANEVERFAHKCYDQDKEDLFRVYYYDCPPFDGSAKNPATGVEEDFSTRPEFASRTRFYALLAAKDAFAFRAGSLKCQGYSVRPRAIAAYFQQGRAIAADDLRPNLRQKGVDIKIGLDISWLASKRIVDRIILCTNDSDFIPAMKFARREGVQIVIASFKPGLRAEMKEHCDEFRVIEFP